MVLQVLDVSGVPLRGEIVARGVEPERVVGQLRGDEPALFGAFQRDRDIGLALRQREGAGDRHELDAQFRKARRQPAEARREEGDAEAVRRADRGPCRRSPCRSGRSAPAPPASRFPSARRHARKISPSAVRSQPFVRRTKSRVFRASSSAVTRRLRVAWLSAEPLRGGEDLAGAGHGEEHADVIPVHRRLLSDAWPAGAHGRWDRPRQESAT